VRRRVSITELENHPNLETILGVLAQLPHIRDDELPRLASAWRNTIPVAAARRKALSPDSPLVVEVLAAFDALVYLFADDLAGDCDFITIEPQVTSIALKAVRDAIAAVYAKPILSRSEYRTLMAPWRAVFRDDRQVGPDLGPETARIRGLLSSLPRLATRCHDAKTRETYDHLVVTAMTLDEDAHTTARETAFRAAVLTGRRRTWAMVRRSAAEGLGRYCPQCRTNGALDESEYDAERVLDLCADAACGLLVADTVDAETTSTLTMPVSALVPLQRRSSLG
jgi:hypothetical protein